MPSLLSGNRKKRCQIHGLVIHGQHRSGDSPVRPSARHHARSSWDTGATLQMTVGDPGSDDENARVDRTDDIGGSLVWNPSILSSDIEGKGPRIGTRQYSQWCPGNRLAIFPKVPGSGTSANTDRAPGTPMIQGAPNTPNDGSVIVRPAVDARPNADGWPHRMFMSGGEAATEPAFGSVTVALDIRLPERPERDENVLPRSSLLGSSAAWDEAADRSSGSRLQGRPNGLCSKCGRLRFGSSPIHLSKSSPAS